VDGCGPIKISRVGRNLARSVEAQVVSLFDRVRVQTAQETLVDFSRQSASGHKFIGGLA
jgi:hypothetical protein